MIPLQDTIPSRQFPLANWVIIGLNTLAFLFELSLPDYKLDILIRYFGLVPARLTDPEWAQMMGYPHSYIPLVTNMFLHSGWGHFIGNMWTLYIFGDNVEDRMGSVRYTLFYLITGIAASITHMLINPTSTIPAIGASGAISGVMAAYMFLFPHSRIVFLFPILFLPYFIELPALLYIGAWFIGQLISGVSVLSITEQAGGIAFWAHIGGFGAGAVLYRLFVQYRYRRTFDDEYMRSYHNYA
ncbi:MAG: rhomboid family intramembrane serine protease [Candidatus Kapaibacterium sp.]|nr:MAG: rhomboid family intramembrane serine protease [Candidatus Kapabacteria bacterium]